MNADNLDDGQGTKGAPKAPAAPSNEPPPKKGDDEEHGVLKTDDEKAKEKEAADKAAADAAAAKEKADREALEAAGPLKEFQVYENPAAAAAVNLLKAEGLGPNEANSFFAEALKTGDINKVDVKGLEKRLGKDKATLVMAGVTAQYNELQAQTVATVKATHDIFGGEDNWKTVRAWAHAKEKADTKFGATVNDIRGLLNEGGTRAESGARELLRLYNADPETKGLGKLVTGDTTGNVIGTPLTRQQYVTELEAAHARGAKPAEIKALDARRKAGMAQRI